VAETAGRIEARKRTRHHEPGLGDQTGRNNSVSAGPTCDAAGEAVMSPGVQLADPASSPLLQNLGIDSGQPNVMEMHKVIVSAPKAAAPKKRVKKAAASKQRRR